MIRKIISDSETVKASPYFRCYNGIATKEEVDKYFDEIVKTACEAYYFAKYIPMANIQRCQDVVCRDIKYTYLFALYIPGADIEKCEEVCIKSPEYAYKFGKNIPGANAEKCFKAAGVI